MLVAPGSFTFSKNERKKLIQLLLSKNVIKKELSNKIKPYRMLFALLD